MNAVTTTWDRIVERVETKVNQYSFNQWFRPIVFVSEGNGTLTLQAPNDLVRDWVQRHYSGLINEALAELDQAGTKVVLLAASEEAPEPAVAQEPTVSAPITSLGGLNPRYSFESFVVGESNQFAEAAARAVAEAPSKSYNPLFIYGGVGLGKTHLMHAVGHYVLNHHSGLRLTYIACERFMNEMINAVKNDRIFEFRERYRSVDVLLVDDIQFLAGKEGTQTEFFHTFNSLYDAQKQIVISGDRPPQEIPAIEERLISRFSWGLIADIQPPNLETRVAILKKKAEADGVPLPDSVALYMAGKIQSNIRELEGSLIRLIAYASLTRQDIDIHLAQEVLKDVVRPQEAVTIEMIQKHVADFFHIRTNDLKQRNNSKSIAQPRQIAMYICRQITSKSLPEIGRAFGGKHHTTVMHSVDTVEEKMRKDRDFHNLVHNLLNGLR
ncbi:MAG: chromosomal replication initiator protein DnaA [Acidobacteria bacterium]|nr:chromosomal replication initiator protein DnaA [Acidobacteriota bacterium]